MKRHAFWGWSLGLALAASHAARADGLTDIGTLGGSYSNATDNNQAGQVVGYASDASNQGRAILWDPTNGMVELGTLGGSYSSASAINDADPVQVIGTSSTATGEQHAFLWDPVNGMVDLGTLGGNYSHAKAINDAGQVVGVSYTSSGVSHAFLWDSVNGMQDLGAIGTAGNSVAEDINEAGQVVGYSYPYAFLWDPSNGMQSLGSLGGSFSEAVAINDAGQVVGQSRVYGGNSHAFLWDATNGMQDLGTLGGISSHARCINEAGQVAGSWSDYSYNSATFLWDPTNGMQNLGALAGGTSSYPNDINELGQVIGTSATHCGYMGFVWDAMKGMQALPTFGGAYGFGNTINDAGQIAGSAYLTDDSSWHAFVGDANDLGSVPVAPVPDMIDLGTLGGTSSNATAVNDFDQVVGQAYTASWNSHAFLWDEANGMQDLGTLGGSHSSASDINNAGQVVGSAQTSSYSNHAFLWDAVNGMQDLGTLGGSYSSPYAVNDNGLVVGLSQASDGAPHAFVWDAVNGMQDLGTPGVYSYAFDVNEAGQVLVYENSRAFVWDAVNGRQDLGMLSGSSYSYPVDINELGQVVGSSDYGGWIWDSVNGMQSLGSLGGYGSYPQAINDLGQVVGYEYDYNYYSRAFIWDSVNGVQDLGHYCNGYSSDAYDINNDGQVIGTSWDYYGMSLWVWSESDGFQPLGNLGSSSGGGVYDISETGRIVGYSTVDNNYNYHAFTLQVATNEPPVAECVAVQLTQIGSLAQASFSGATSTDLEDDQAGIPLTFAWVISDAATAAVVLEASGEQLNEYLAYGDYDVTLTVTDSGGASDTCTTQLSIDPALLAIFECEQTEVNFCVGDADSGSDDDSSADADNSEWTSDRVKVRGTIGLPMGVDHSELEATALVVLDVAGVDFLGVGSAPILFDVYGSGDRHWKYEDDTAALGVTRFEIDWKGARFKYRGKDVPVELESQLITSTETVLRMDYSVTGAGGPFTVDIDGTVLDVDASGVVTSGDLPAEAIEVKKVGKKVTITLPFALIETSTVTLGGSLSETVFVADHYTNSLGRFKLEAESGSILAAGADTTPRTTSLMIGVGGPLYPGICDSSPDDLRVHSRKWRTIHHKADH